MILPKKSVLECAGYDIPLYPEKYVMKLDINENPLGPSPRVIEALKNVSPDDIKIYPAYGELINKIADHNSVDNTMVLPTNGADEAINYLFHCFIDSTDTVITVKPAFSMPKIYARGVGCTYKEIPYTEKWVFPIDDFVAALAEKPKMAIITTPNNPTGEAISRQHLERIIEAAPDTVIMIDETYANYSEELFTDLVKKYSNVFIVRSFSKDFALAGLRLGYILSDEVNIQYLKRIISPYSVNSMAVKAGIAAINDSSYFEWVKDNINQSRLVLREGLRPFVKKFYQTDANFLFADFGERVDFVYKKLINNGIKVKEFKSSPELKTYLRITYPSPEQAKILVDTLKPRDMIVFDMDGVLIDTSNSYRLAIKSTFEHFSSMTVSAEKIQEAKNLGGLNNDWDLTEYLLKSHGFNIPKKDIISKFQEFYAGENGYINNETFLLDAEFVRNLYKHFDLGIFTGRPKDEAIFALKKWGIEDIFLSIVTMEDVPDGFHKPSPWGLEHIKEVSLSPKILYLGDTADDMKAASLAKVTGLGVLPPQDKSEDLKNRLKSAGAVVILEETENLANFLEEECKIF